MENRSLLLSMILDIGENLLISGAEVNRVEDTIKRISSAYGFLRTDVFTITSSIVVTVTDEDQEIYTQTRRIVGYKTDMYKIEQLNSLSRQICRQPLTNEMLKECLNGILKKDVYPRWLIYLFYGIIAASFTLFYGGSMLDAVTSLLCGLFLRLIMEAGTSIRIQPIVLVVLCSFLVGSLAIFFVSIGIGNSFDEIMIGNIMLLIPGVSFTISLRDMISGDTISGLLGLCEAILKALAIAIGFAMVIFLWGGVH